MFSFLCIIIIVICVLALVWICFNPNALSGGGIMENQIRGVLSSKPPNMPISDNDFHNVLNKEYNEQIKPQPPNSNLKMILNDSAEYALLIKVLQYVKDNTVPSLEWEEPFISLGEGRNGSAYLITIRTSEKPENQLICVKLYTNQAYAPRHHVDNITEYIRNNSISNDYEIVKYATEKNLKYSIKLRLDLEPSLIEFDFDGMSVSPKRYSVYSAQEKIAFEGWNLFDMSKIKVLITEPILGLTKNALRSTTDMPSLSDDLIMMYDIIKEFLDNGIDPIGMHDDNIALEHVGSPSIQTNHYKFIDLGKCRIINPITKFSKHIAKFLSIYPQLQLTDWAMKAVMQREDVRVFKLSAYSSKNISDNVKERTYDFINYSCAKFLSTKVDHETGIGIAKSEKDAKLLVAILNWSSGMYPDIHMLVSKNECQIKVIILQKLKQIDTAKIPLPDNSYIDILDDTPCLVFKPASVADTFYSSHRVDYTTFDAILQGSDDITYVLEPL